jgi:TetR/AcrR family transcriptional regulator
MILVDPAADVNRGVHVGRIGRGEGTTGVRQVPAKLASKLYGAAELIAERGLADAKIDEIAEAAGIPKATLYYYFSGKEEILAFLLGDVLELIAGEVGAAVTAPGTARKRLEKAVEAQLTVMLEHPALCRALVGDLGRATRLPELALALQTAFHQPIEDLLAEGVNDGTLRRVDHPGAVALSIFGAITVAGLSVAVEGPSKDPAKDAARSAASICDLLLTGLATSPVNDDLDLEGSR